MAYIYPDFPSKAAIKRALKAGDKLRVKENKPWAVTDYVQEGEVTVEGPHYPKPHRWYGKVVVKNGLVISVT